MAFKATQREEEGRGAGLLPGRRKSPRRLSLLARAAPDTCTLRHGCTQANSSVSKVGPGQQAQLIDPDHDVTADLK